MAAQPCKTCRGTGISGVTVTGHIAGDCDQCGGRGFLGVDPAEPCSAAPGTLLKIATIQARYEAGLPFWHDADKYEQDELPASHILLDDDEDNDE